MASKIKKQLTDLETALTTGDAGEAPVLPDGDSPRVTKITPATTIAYDHLVYRKRYDIQPQDFFLRVTTPMRGILTVVRTDGDTLVSKRTYALPGDEGEIRLARGDQDSFETHPAFIADDSEPLTAGGLILNPGVTIIVGPTETGKTWVLENVTEELSITNAAPYRTLLHREPLQSGRLLRANVRERLPLNDTQLLQELSTFILSNDKLIFLDGMSAEMFMNYSRWNTATFGLNTGLFFWLTELHNLLLVLRKTLVVTLRPPSAVNPDVVRAIEEFSVGNTGAALILTSFGSGVYRYRAPDGSRATITDLSRLFARVKASGSINPRVKANDINLNVPPVDVTDGWGR
jgi:hypothetical protein